MPCRAASQVELVPGGRDIAVTGSNLRQYVQRVLEYRTHEVDTQVDSILQGMSEIMCVRAASPHSRIG